MVCNQGPATVITASEMSVIARSRTVILLSNHIHLGLRYINPDATGTGLSRLLFLHENYCISLPCDHNVNRQLRYHIHGHCLNELYLDYHSDCLLKLPHRDLDHD